MSAIQQTRLGRKRRRLTPSQVPCGMLCMTCLPGRISLLVHVGILVVMASVTFVTVIEPSWHWCQRLSRKRFGRKSLSLIRNPPNSSAARATSISSVPSMAAAQHQGVENHREEVSRLEEQIINPDIPVVETFLNPNEAQILEPIDLTGTTEHAGGTEGAIDRITQEIAASLRQRKTLVVWLFDESLSLEARRTEVSERFENIYRQLGLMDVDTKEALKTALSVMAKTSISCSGNPPATLMNW